MNPEQNTSATKLVSPNFSWSLEGRIIAIDNGGTLSGSKSFDGLMQLNTLAVITFDPANRLANHDNLKGIEEFQLISGATLGDGQPATMYACLDENLSSTLKPIAPDKSTTESLAPNRIIAEHPISTLSLDAIEGLKSVDWLILDSLHDNLVILDNGKNALKETLLIQVCIPFAESHQQKSGLLKIHQWMTNHGFRLYCFNNSTPKSNLPTNLNLEKEIATELDWTDAIYIPNAESMEKLKHSDLTKLAFILHTVYGCHDLAYKLLSMIDSTLAASYLMTEGYIWPINEEATTFDLTYEYSPDIWG